MTADQIAARELGKDTPLPSLELAIDLNSSVGNCENGYSCAYLNTLAWRTPTTPLPTENNPRVVFERLFGDGGTPTQRAAPGMRKNRSILDSVTDEMARLQRRLGPRDRAEVDRLPRLGARSRAAHSGAESSRRQLDVADARAADRRPGGSTSTSS